MTDGYRLWTRVSAFRLKMLDEVLKISLQTTTQFPAIEFVDEVHVSDGALVQAVLSGDNAAFKVIFEKYKRPMTRVVSRYFRERSDIEEFVQQCFTKVYFSLKNFRGGGDAAFPAWMTRIAVNVCYDEFRRRQRKAENLFSEMSDEENDYVETLVDGRRPSVESLMIAAQLAEKVLAGLDTEDRMAMTLVYSEDYSLDEAAGAIGITTSNLKSRLFRCRNHIRKRFGHLFA
jgi:RNA polymerase sigma-70 factor, ECF subfamily